MPAPDRICPVARRVAIVLLALAATACGGGHGVEPGAATSWPTWVLPTAAAIRVPPPPAPGSPAARADRARLLAAVHDRTRSTRGAIAAWNPPVALQPWIELAMHLGSERGKDPPATSRAYALVSVAIYDAVLASWHWKFVYHRMAPAGMRAVLPTGNVPTYPSEHAAIAGAASRVLEYAFPAAPAARLEQMAREAAWSRVQAGAAAPSDVAAGLALGRRVAAAVIARARRDGYGRHWNGHRPRGVAHWAPPPGSTAAPVDPAAGTWRTWVLRSGHQLRPPPPPAYGSPAFLRQVRAVMRAHAQLTPGQERTARFWAGGVAAVIPPGIWNQVALAYLRHEPRDVPGQARVMALLDVAMADAGIAVWDAKYAYWSPRPVNAIRDLRLNPRWRPLLPTPYFPSYVSGHAAYSGAASEVLAYLFPDGAALFRAKAREAATSRLWAGIHFPVDNAVGLRLGREIGRLVVARARRDGAGS